MEKRSIFVITLLDNKKETQEYKACINNNIIKYYEIDRTKVTVDVMNNIIIRENSDSIIKIFINNSIIEVLIKEFNSNISIPVEILLFDKNSKEFSLKYKIFSENIINGYDIKY